MRSCCHLTFVVFTGIASIAAIVAVTVPLLMITSQGGSSTGAQSSVLSNAILNNGTVGISDKHRAAFRTQASSSPSSVLKCPLFGGYCSAPPGGPVVFTQSITTTQFLELFDCPNSLGVARTFAVLSILMATATAIVGFLGSRLEHRRGFLKLVASGCAFVTCVFAGVGSNSQLHVKSCLMDSWLFVQTYDGYYLTMVSTIVELAAGGLMFWCMICMLCSYWCGWCGEPPGSLMYQQGGAVYIPIVAGQQPVYQGQGPPGAMAMQYQQQPVYGQPVYQQAPAYSGAVTPVMGQALYAPQV